MGGETEIDGGWRVTLRAMAFVLDAANLSRLGGDLLEPLVFAAIVQANQAPLRADSELDRRYAASGETLPDDLRRPISIHAVAQSLGLPFETVRRRVMALETRGFCIATAAGVYVPAAAIASEVHAGIQARRLARLARFHDELAALGFLAPEERSPGFPPSLARAANRFLSQYMLRASQRLNELAGGPMEAFVLLGLCCENAARLLAAETETASLGEALEPCTGLALARRLEIPRENARRYLQRLSDAGYARGTKREWFATVPKGSEARVRALAADDAADLHRLFARLRELADAPPARDAGAG